MYESEQHTNTICYWAKPTHTTTTLCSVWAPRPLSHHQQNLQGICGPGASRIYYPTPETVIKPSQPHGEKTHKFFNMTIENVKTVEEDQDGMYSDNFNTASMYASHTYWSLVNKLYLFFLICKLLPCALAEDWGELCRSHDKDIAPSVFYSYFSFPVLSPFLLALTTATTCENGWKKGDDRTRGC